MSVFWFCLIAFLDYFPNYLAEFSPVRSLLCNCQLAMFLRFDERSSDAYIGPDDFFQEKT